MQFFRTSLVRAFALCLITCGLLFTSAHAGYIYVSTDSAAGNNIYGFSVNETTGELTALPGFPVSTGFVGAALTNLELATVDPVNKRLYVANRGSSNISAYSIDEATGAITPLPFSPITSVANQRTLKVHPSGSPLIVGADTFASFVITPTSATHAPGSPYAMPTGVSPAASALSPSGTYYYAGGNSGNFFAGFSVNAATGELTALAGSPFDSGGTTSPIPLAVDAAEGRLFLANPRQSVIRVFTLASGVPTAATGNPFTITETGFAAVGRLHPNGEFLPLPNRTRNHVYSLKIAGTGAATTVSTVAGSPFLTGGTTSQAGLFNAAGNFFFIANGGSRNITRFAFDATTGVLSEQFVQASNTMGSEGSLSGLTYLPTASVSLVTLGGKVLDANGRAVSRAMVTLEAPGEEPRIAVTNTFGNYRFTGVATGTTYTVSAIEKRNNFQSQTVTLTSERLDVNLVPVVNTLSKSKN